MKKLLIYVINACIITCSLLYAQALTGIWENTERLIEYTATENQESYRMRVVLKPYYRFVYEDAGTYETTVVQAGPAKALYQLSIRYPNTKKQTSLPVWIDGDKLFTSFYKKEAFEVISPSPIAPQTDNLQQRHEDPLEGFWIEQGHRSGICIYPQEPPEFLDAYFFMHGSYIKFRYWKDNELESKKSTAQFQLESGATVSVPKLLERSGCRYSCITSNSTTLRNYEKGSYHIATESEAPLLTLTAQGGGPGSRAVADTYPHQRYAPLRDVPLSYSTQDGTFAFGLPFLTRSALSDLDAEIQKHNSIRRPPPEPLLKADEVPIN
ncbi:MAG: hypothetical protein ACTTJ7_00345 [Treponema sp.]